MRSLPRTQRAEEQRLQQLCGCGHGTPWRRVHSTGRKLRPTEPGASFPSFLQAGTSAVWEMRFAGGGGIAILK